MGLRGTYRNLLGSVATRHESWGTDAVPAGDDAIYWSDPEITPLAGGTVQRKNSKQTLGADAQIHVNTHVLVNFSVELAAAGTKDVAPAYGPLLRGCDRPLGHLGHSGVAENHQPPVDHDGHGASDSDGAVEHEITALALAAEAEHLELADDLEGERIVELCDVDIGRAQTGLGE